ncbi:UvrD-helicase domain-containing protein [Alteromonas halophila]|uniref:DNA 3'-5' helicase n=1 Tax=Alteromonas halophila TaxID=516698 RepID=A0A918JRM8_9ALTE|nr:ATP-dependent helicase [Alteromonas halophila]GGW96633.1 DNA helicase [Alteromonas halophila]
MISTELWQPANGLELEPNALLAAKEQLRCLALTAGPGAGKTEMLAQRADFLLQTGTCRYPKRILAISFKVDASKNLKERIQKRCGFELGSRFDSYTFHAFAKRIIDRFRGVLTGNDALDADYKIGDRKITRRQITFQELVPLATQILRTSNLARSAVRQTYTDVFLDEFQDCTNQQYELVKIVFQNTDIRLTAVGDTKQKIMGWAGALDGIFQTFADDFSAIPLNMYRNFRSKPRLLRLQNEIIRELDPDSVMQEDQLTGEDGEVTVSHFNNAEEEAEYIADTILDWIGREGIPLNEIAILVSKQLELYAAPLMSAFEIRRIPYRNEQQMQDITVEPAARLIVDYLSCLYGQKEPDAWTRLMDLLIPVSQDEINTKNRRGIRQFFKEQREAITVAKELGDRYSEWWSSVRSFLNYVGTNTLVTLSADYESQDRLRDIVAETKSRIEGLLEIEPDLLTALARFSDEHAVRILTIHKSKGLEFHSTIIMAIEEEIFFGDQIANRCAFFVGISRAKQRLVLTSVNHRDRPEDFTGRWSEKRTPKNEYIEYANQVLDG